MGVEEEQLRVYYCLKLLLNVVESNIIQIYVIFFGITLYMQNDAKVGINDCTCNAQEKFEF